MRVKSPPAFDLLISGPEGIYTLSYTLLDEWDGEIEAVIAGVVMKWPVFVIEKTEEGLYFGGMTTGSQPLWNDCFWFALWPDLKLPRIDYWGDRVLWRSDLGQVPGAISA